ncbi:MAG: transcription antitermination factor NusB [Nocardioides sp.]|jgi:N utilization substance protein B
MAARHKARKRALDILYAAEMRGESPVLALERAIADGDAPHNPYTAVLVRGVATHAGEIDALLRERSRGWTLERMPAIDRNVLRIGTYEILFADDVPAAVAVSEAVVLVKELSTDESPAFVNGLLDAIATNPSVTTPTGDSALHD